MKEYKHKEGYYIGIVANGIITYNKKSEGNKLRLKEIARIDMLYGGGYPEQSEPLIKMINQDFIRINDSNIIDSPWFEKNRELYEQIKNQIK